MHMSRVRFPALVFGAAILVSCDGSGGDTLVLSDGGQPRQSGDARSSSSAGDRPLLSPLDGGGRRDAQAPEARMPRTIALNAMAKQVLPSGWELLGTHRSACSHGLVSQGASAERWCAVSRPGMRIGTRELWVINIHKAMAGDVKCDGSSPSCVRLATDLFTGQPEAGPAYPTSHRFTGDVLIYYANAQSRASDLYKGEIFAWKPGWDAGKAIASKNGVLCSGHGRASVAVCIENITPDGVEPVEFDLHAGPIGDGPLKKIARIVPLRSQNGASQWRSGFTGDGKWFAYSTGGKTARDVETLYVMRTEDIGQADKVITVGRGLSRWGLSADGKRWFYLKNFNYDTEGAPKGNLYMANFPDGTDQEALISDKVGAFQILVDADEKDRGVVFLHDVKASRGTFKFVWDVTKPEDPMSQVEVVKSIASVPIMSPDLGKSFYAKDFDEDTGLSDAWITPNQTPKPCALTTGTEASIFGSPFSRSGSLAFWADRIDLDTDSGEGWVAQADGCAMKRKFSDGIDFWFIYGDQGMVYTDGSDGDLVSLRVLKFTADGKGLEATRGTELQKAVERIYAVLPNFEATVFAIAASNDDKQNGLYALKLPFDPPTAVDAGARPDGPRASADAAGLSASDAAGVDAVSGGAVDASAGTSVDAVSGVDAVPAADAVTGG
jgi:hypothetical protein